MMENRIVQHHDSRPLECPPVNFGVLPVIAQVIKRDVTSFGRNLDRAKLPQSVEKRRGVISHARPRRRERRMETDRHAFFRLPNSAVPTRTHVDPSSIATSRSPDIPIESW